MLFIREKINNFRSSTFFITAVICYAIFVDQLFFAFILPILPFSLPERNGVREDKVQYWTVVLIVVFGVATLVSCPIIGWWTDRFTSRRLPFLAGLVVLLASTLLIWLAKPMWAQVLSRVGQGLTDAFIYVVGLTIIIDTVSEKHVAEYMGHVMIALNVGTFAGPLLGGVVFYRAGYHAVWIMMCGFVALDAFLRLFMLEKTDREQPKSSFQPAETKSAQELLLLDPEKVASHHISSPTLTVRSPCIVHNSRPAQQCEEPEFSNARWTNLQRRLPALVTLLFSVRMDVALFGVFIEASIFSGFETVLALYVQEIWHYNSLGAGLIFIPLTVPAFFGPLLGKAVDQTTPRWAIVAGFLGQCPILVVAKFVKSNSMGQKALMCVLLVLIGLGITLTTGPLTAEVSHVAKEAEEKKAQENSCKMCGQRLEHRRGGGSYAQAYALFTMAWAVGNIAGPLLCGFIKDKAGWSTMCWALGVVSGVTAVPCLI